MSDTVRFGVSLSLSLLDEFDALIKRLGYATRSEAVRDMIRQKLVAEEWEAPDKETFAVVLLVYEHHAGALTDKLNDIQHHACKQIVGSFHVHMDEDNCVELVLMRGKGKQLRTLADQMVSLKGVKYSALNMGTGAQKLR
jgi:CopG family nickel-responsive transcriptional regulator